MKNLREGLAVPYEAYEEIEPRCVGCGVVRGQVRFRFTITMFYYSIIKKGDTRGVPKRASTRASGSNIARGTSRPT